MTHATKSKSVQVRPHKPSATMVSFVTDKKAAIRRRDAKLEHLLQRLATVRRGWVVVQREVLQVLVACLSVARCEPQNGLERPHGTVTKSTLVHLKFLE